MRRKLVQRAFGQNDDRFVNRSATLEAVERVNDDWDAGDFPELLGTSAAHPTAPTGGDDDCDVHKDRES